jgi:hypothetical protein
MSSAARRASIVLTVLLALTQLATAQTKATKPPFRDVESFVAYINAHIRAPFDRDSVRLPQGAATQLMKNAAKAKPLAAAAGAAGTHNVKVNQDRNSWPKAEVGSAVDPVTGQN